MLTLKIKGSDSSEVFYLERIVRVPDTDSFIALAKHSRTDFPVEATISLHQVFDGLLACYVQEVARWYFERLKDDNIVDLKSMEGKTLLVSGSQLVQFGFDLNDVLQSARS